MRCVSPSSARCNIGNQCHVLVVQVAKQPDEVQGNINEDDVGVAQRRDACKATKAQSPDVPSQAVQHVVFLVRLSSHESYLWMVRIKAGSSFEPGFDLLHQWLDSLMPWIIEKRRPMAARDRMNASVDTSLSWARLANFCSRAASYPAMVMLDQDVDVACKCSFQVYSASP